MGEFSWLSADRTILEGILSQVKQLWTDAWALWVAADKIDLQLIRK